MRYRAPRTGLGVSRVVGHRVIDPRPPGRLARYEPSRNAVFSFVRLSRAGFPGSLLTARTDAIRGAVDLDGNLAESLCPADSVRKRPKGRFRSARQIEPAGGSSTRTTEAILVEDDETEDEKG